MVDRDKGGSDIAGHQLAGSMQGTQRNLPANLCTPEPSHAQNTGIEGVAVPYAKSSREASENLVALCGASTRWKALDHQGIGMDCDKQEMDGTRSIVLATLQRP